MFTVRVIDALVWPTDLFGTPEVGTGVVWALAGLLVVAVVGIVGLGQRGGPAMAGRRAV